MSSLFLPGYGSASTSVLRLGKTRAGDGSFVVRATVNLKVRVRVEVKVAVGVKGGVRVGRNERQRTCPVLDQHQRTFLKWIVNCGWDRTPR